MNESYSVLVKLSLQNQVSAGLMMMSGQFTKLQAQATLLQTKLTQIKTMALTGAGLFAAGYFGIDLITKALKPAEEYAHQLNIMHMAGMKNVEVAEAIKDAWKNTSNVITTSATDNLKSLLDMRNILGDINEARMALPYVTKMQAVLLSSKEGSEVAKDPDFAFSVAKALDIIGAVKNKKEFEIEAEMMAKSMIATQGRVHARMYQQTFAYARQARYGLDNAFKYEILPSLILEYTPGSSPSGGGGGSRGVGPMLAAFYRLTNQGYVNRKSLDLLKQLGLVNPYSALRTTTSGTTVGPLKSADLAASNPFLWVQDILLPALRKKFGQNISNAQIQKYINEINRGNQMSGSLMTEFATKGYAFIRDQNIIRHSMSTSEAYNRAILNDPTLARQALSKQWENLQISLTKPLLIFFIPVLQSLANSFNYFANVLEKYPNLAKALIYAFTILSGTLLFSGTVLLLSAAFRGLMVTFTLMKGGMIGLLALDVPLLLIVGAVALVGIALYELYVHWDVVKAKIKQLGDAFVYLGHLIQNLFYAASNKYHNFAKSNPNTAKVISAAGEVGSFLLNPVGKIESLFEYGKNLIKNPNTLSHQVIMPHNSKNIPRNNQPIHVHTHTVMKVDGRTLGHITGTHLYDAASGVPNGSSQFDTSLSPMPTIANSYGIP